MPAGRCRNYRTSLQAEQDETKRRRHSPFVSLTMPQVQKKRSAFPSGALLYREDDTLINFNKLRIARADHALCIYKAVHVNGDPTAVHKHEVRVANQPEMSLSVSLDEELFRMPPKTEHFGMTRPELLLVHSRRLIRVPHVCLSRGRMHSSFMLVYVLSMTLNGRLSTCACTHLRLCLRFPRLRLFGVHLLPFRRRRSLRFFRLRLLRFRCLA